MIHLPPEWETYIEALLPELDPLLDELESHTHWHTPYPQMLSGKWQAAFLHFLIKVKGAKKVLEIGTFTGYATLAMAQALPQDGRITTLEKSEENAAIARAFFRRSPYGKFIELHSAPAGEWLESHEEFFDLVFLDADKEHYPLYFPLVKRHLVPGAWWITDNILWNGKVPEGRRDAQTAGIARFNRMMKADPDFLSMPLPVRDGLMWSVYLPANGS